MSKPRIVAYDPKRKMFCTLTESKRKNREILIGKCGLILTKEEFKDYEKWTIDNAVDYWYYQYSEERYIEEDLYEKDRVNWALKRSKKELRDFYKSVYRRNNIVFVCYEPWDDSVPLIEPKKLEPLISTMKKRFHRRTEKDIEEHKKILQSFPTYEQFVKKSTLDILSIQEK